MRLFRLWMPILALFVGTSSAVHLPFAALSALTSSSHPSLSLLFQVNAFWNVPLFNPHFFEDAVKLGWEKIRDGAIEQFERAAHIIEDLHLDIDIEPFKQKIGVLVAEVHDLREHGGFHVDSAAGLEAEQEKFAIIHLQAMINMENFSSELEQLLDDLQGSLEAQFPDPESAPSHAQRVERVAAALSQVEDIFVQLGVKHGVDEDKARKSFRRISPALQDVVILAGDLSEQHSGDLLEAVMIGGIMLILPESLILRPLFGLFGWGPYGPVKGSFAAWAQRFFFGPVVEKDSWFAILQSWTMKNLPWWKRAYNWIFGASKA